MVVRVKGMEPAGVSHSRVFALFFGLQPLRRNAFSRLWRSCGRGPFSTTVGTEELGHLEMVGTIVHQLTRNLTEEQIKEAGFEPYFVDHTTGVFPQFASGYPWSASTMQVTGATIADLTEDLAAEQKARVTYDNILRLSDDPDVSDVIKFLRAREIVHFQRFGEGLRLAKDRLDEKNVYYVNPSFDQ